MRQRITLFHKAEDSINPKDIKVTKDSVQIARVKAAREDKITFSVDDLPLELRLVLNQSHELHIRYVSQTPYDTVSPLLSRLSPGLHVLYSPQRIGNESNLLCPLLSKTFGLTAEELCITPEKSFTNLPTQRFQHSTALQYYLPHTQITAHTPIDYILSLCPTTNKHCLSRVELLRFASYIDIDYNTITHTLSLTAFWPATTPSAFHLTTPSSHNSRLEVGLLSAEPPNESEELSLGGFLTSLGDGEESGKAPSPTLFSFPARHHIQSAQFSTDFLLPTGFHPTLRLSVSDARPPETTGNCRLHAYLTLPSIFFVDKYQFQDSLFLASHNLSSLRYITIPVDLEAPDYAVTVWGSSVLVELSPPLLSKSTPSSKSISFTATVPLHLRYLHPSPSGHRSAHLPLPALFWACTADEGSKFAINPFDRVNLGYEGLFGPRTMFYHLSPHNSLPDLVLSGSNGTNAGYVTVEVPVLKIAVGPGSGGLWYLGVERIEFVTATVILLGFGWVLWMLGRVAAKSEYSAAALVVKGETEVKKTQ